ncbi:MAG TPA: DUF177 domain-containing protein [Acidimicrobiales bacterium]|jgi:uncharacterized protein|nr:DUF177 domain-containing protein [Acidimicrobiales bacterium]
MGPFVVNVADLVNRPGARRRERVVGTLGGLRVGDASVPAGNEVAVEVLLEWVTDGVLASGDTRARWVGDCRRCLGPVGGELRVEFRELFEAEPREGESYPLRNDRLDLAPLAREVLLLDLPLAPLCADECRGLCPTCGADLNRGDCECVAELGDPRWAALDVLRGDGGQAD